MTSPRRILHCITGLTPDGAQRMLYRLTSVLHGSEQQVRVVSLSAREPFADEFEKLGIQVSCLNMRPSAPSPQGVMKLSRIIREWRPDVVQGWMYHANLLALVSARFSRTHPAVIWNIRRSLYDRSLLRRSTRLVITANAASSRWVDGIVYCAKASAAHHRRAGFTCNAEEVIGNGFSIEPSLQSELAREHLLSRLNISARAFVVGVVGRNDPAKDYTNFLAAAALLKEKLPEAKFIMVGRGVPCDAIKSQIRLHSLQGSIFLFEQQSSVWDFMSGIDVYCSSSRSEGFPNVIAEAMAYSLPCVVTDVGASRELVEDIGVVVPPRNPHALAEGLLHFAALPKEERLRAGLRARERISEHYSVNQIAARYTAFYEKILNSREIPARVCKYRHR